MGAISDISNLLDKIPVWKKLKELPDKFISLENRVKKLENKFETSSEIKCPFCGAYQYFVIESNSHPDPQLAMTGVIIREYKCKNCNKGESKHFTANQ